LRPSNPIEIITARNLLLKNTSRIIDKLREIFLIIHNLLNEFLFYLLTIKYYPAINKASKTIITTIK
jgi:hypothetical protein